MIFIKVDKSDDVTKARIMSKLYVPFDAVNGLKKSDGSLYTIDEKDQMEKDFDGYLVDYTQDTEPKPENQAGKIAQEYFNTQTREYIFEYIDAPIQHSDNDDLKSLVMQMLKDSIE